LRILFEAANRNGSNRYTLGRLTENAEKRRFLLQPVSGALAPTEPKMGKNGKKADLCSALFRARSRTAEQK